MQSIELLSGLKQISPEHTYKTKAALINDLQRLKDRDILVEASLYSGILAYRLLETRNISDDLFTAYAAQYPNLSLETTLYEKYLEVSESGDTSILGLVNGIKGKAFELHVQDNLEERYPSMTFELSERANEPVWDIRATDSAGQETFIQVKLMDASNASGLIEKMEANPDVLFATSTEIREKIIAQNPHLEEQFMEVDTSSYEFTQSVTEELEMLKQNLGIDLPDEVFALAPYSTEILLGIKLLLDLAKVQRDFSHVQTTEKSRLAAVKVLILMSRFGVNAILGIAGGAAGSAVLPGVGTVIGSIGGIVTGSIINKKIAPFTLELVYKLLKIDEEDVFYYRNSDQVHQLALNLHQQRKSLEGAFI